MNDLQCSQTIGKRDWWVTINIQKVVRAAHTPSKCRAVLIITGFLFVHLRTVSKGLRRMPCFHSSISPKPPRLTKYCFLQGLSRTSIFLSYPLIAKQRLDMQNCRWTSDEAPFQYRYVVDWPWYCRVRHATCSSSHDSTRRQNHIGFGWLLFSSTVWYKISRSLFPAIHIFPAWTARLLSFHSQEIVRVYNISINSTPKSWDDAFHSVDCNQ